jgi:hypothetical protein
MCLQVFFPLPPAASLLLTPATWQGEEHNNMKKQHKKTPKKGVLKKYILIKN